MKKLTRKHLEPLLAEYATTEKILDLGSGGSSYQRYFPNRLTVDIDPLRKPDIVADAHHLPFKDEEFTFVLCTEMLEHVQDPFQVEKEIRRITAKGGTLLLTTRFTFPLHDVPHDYWRYTKYGLRRLFSEWEVLELRGETETFSTIGALLQRISFQTKLHLNKPMKALLEVLIWMFDHLNWLIVKEYGNIEKTRPETEIMPTGYYLVCRKK